MIVLIGIAFGTMPFAEVAFARLGDAFAEPCVLEAFAVLAVACRAVVVGVLRGVHKRVLIGFVTFEASPNNPLVTMGRTCVTIFS